MKIIQVYQTNPFEEGQGGGVRYVINLLNEIKSNCDEILFLGIGENHLKDDNIEFISITGTLTSYVYFLFKLMIKLLFINTTKYDVVHVHRLYFAIPFILLKPKLKIVCSLHGRTFSVFESNYGSWKLKIIKPIFMMIEKFSIKHIDYFVPVSHDVLNNFKNKYPKLMESKKDKTEILGSMMDLGHFVVQDSNFLQKQFGIDNKYVLFIGRLADVKDIEFLIKMFAEKFQDSSNVKLIIAGDGEKKDDLKNLAKQKCQKNEPIFLGEVKPEVIPKLISSSNVVVLCSKHEASPTVIKEALSCGVPMVTNKIGDVDKFIKNDKNGLVVEKTFEAYVTAINKLLDNPLNKNDVRINSEKVLNKCTVEYISEQYIKIYKKVITE